MDSWVLFFLIVVGLPVMLGVFGDVAKRWMKLKEKQLDQAATLAASLAAEKAAHIDRLEERVRVLERIVTDRAPVALAHEIERLRDDRPN